jgi:DNA polymerase-3 subunit gamma/tau
MNGQKLEYAVVVKSLNILDHVVYFQFVEQIESEQSDQVLLLLNDVIANGFDLEVFLSGLAEHIRHLWVARKESTLMLLEFNQEVKSQFVAQSKNLDEAYLLNLLQVISECEVQMKTTRNRRLVVELALLKMTYLKKMMKTSWTELGEKKKSEPIVPEARERESTTTVAANPPSAPGPNQLGIKFDDILNKVERKLIQEPKKKPEYKPIEDVAIWQKLIEKFDGNMSETQMLQTLKPHLNQDTFVVRLESENLAKLIEPCFARLGKIYTEITGDLARFQCQIDQTSLPEDITKKQAFEDLAAKYPILMQIHETFQLDFHT